MWGTSGHCPDLPRHCPDLPQYALIELLYCLFLIKAYYLFRMVRTYVKKRSELEVCEESIKNAVSNVLRGTMSLRTAASAFDVKKSTLHERVSKARQQGTRSDSGNDSDQEPPCSSKYSTRQVFSKKEESELELYLKQSSQILYGLTYMATRKLA